MKVLTFTNGKVDLRIDTPDLEQAAVILKNSLVLQQLAQLEVTVDGCTAYWDNSLQQLIKGAPWDKAAASVSAGEAQLAKQIVQENAAMLPTKSPNRNLSGKTQDKRDW